MLSTCACACTTPLSLSSSCHVGVNDGLRSHEGRGGTVLYKQDGTARARRGEVAYLYYSLFFFLYNSMSIVTAALWRRFCSMSFSRVFFALILVCRLCTTGGLCFPFCYAQNVCFGVCVSSSCWWAVISYNSGEGV